jgi:murein DD-endopeptidase MepM/ murein hydrolase activator NlpD
MNKTGGAVTAAGLGGFLVGALTVLFIVWAYTGFQTQDGLPTVPPASGQAGVAVQPAPAEVPPALPAALPEMFSDPAPRPPAEDSDLSRRNLLLPVQGVTPESLCDTFNDARSGGRVHNALDILAPRNTPVLAVEGGRVAKLFTSKQGGLTIYQFDPAETYAYYYAHLESYAEGLAEGNFLRRGQVIGFVGTSGNAPPDTPHLHFAIFRLTPEKRWWEGEPVNPFAILGGRAEPAR